MAKKKISVAIRKPPPTDMDAFVSGRKPKKRADLSSLEAGPITKTDKGVQLREVWLYVPESLARELAVYCADRDRNASTVMSDLLRNFLDAQRANERSVSNGSTLVAECIDLVTSFLKEKAPAVARAFSL